MPSAYFELALRVFGSTPAADAALREGTGVSSEGPGPEITLGQQLVQVRNINRLLPSGWGLRVGSRLEATAHGPVAFAAVSAPTLGDSLAVVERFSHVRSPYFQFRSCRDAGRFALRVENRLGLDPDAWIPMIECVLLGVQKVVEPVLGEPMSESAFHFAWAPPSYADDYRHYYHGTVHFHARDTALAIPSQWLDLKCPMADPVTYAESIRTLEVLARRLDGNDHVVARVEQLIAAGDKRLSLEQVATREHLSTRSLIRRLRGAGTTYQELLDTHRQERARALLRNRDFGIAEVSDRLGYGDPANFGRACRRWFGMAPGRYRRQLLET